MNCGPALCVKWSKPRDREDGVKFLKLAIVLLVGGCSSIPASEPDIMGFQWFQRMPPCVTKQVVIDPLLLKCSRNQCACTIRWANGNCIAYLPYENKVLRDHEERHMNGEDHLMHRVTACPKREKPSP